MTSELADFATAGRLVRHEPARVAAFFAEQGSLTINEGAPSVGRVAISAAAQGFMTAFPNMVVIMDSLEHGRRSIPLDPDRYQHGPEARPAGAYQRLRGMDFGPDGRDWPLAGPHFDEVEYQRQLQGT
jgi:hypothetical protein